LFPVFHGFRGGKGVAAYLGFTAWVAPVGAAAAAGAWVLTFALVRIPFVGSFVMVAVLSVATALALEWDVVACAGAAVTAVLIMVAHRSNISRLRQRRDDASTGKK
jgi:glycerol-3-phosphate acyltransferase PlsY